VANSVELPLEGDAVSRLQQQQQQQQQQQCMA
jgi:hypothetical protein